MTYVKHGDGKGWRAKHVSHLAERGDPENFKLGTQGGQKEKRKVRRGGAAKKPKKTKKQPEDKKKKKTQKK